SAQAVGATADAPTITPRPSCSGVTPASCRMGVTAGAIVRKMPDVRRARPSDAEAITATITSAFHNDPVWRWAFPDDAARPAQFTKWWWLFVDAALRDGWV